MKLDYDAKDDVLYFHFRDGPAESVKEVEDNVMVELDDDGEVMGIEVWGAKKNGVLRQLTNAVSH
jgi:uncharacterized protein YuzE